MTGNELLAIARNGRPNIRYEFNYKKTLIGAWVEEKKRFVAVAGKIIGENEKWLSMPYELLIDGQPAGQNGWPL